MRFARLHLLTAIVVALALAGLAARCRERLVPRDADPQRAAWRLTGDEPGYLLLARAIAAGDGLDVGPEQRRGGYRAYQDRPVIGEGQWTWRHYRELLPRPPWIDRSARWGESQVLPRLPLYPALIAPLVRSPPRVRWNILALQSVLFSAAAFFTLILAGSSDRPLRDGACTLALLGSLPVIYYTAQIFPETLAGTFLLLALACWSRGGRWEPLGHLLLGISLWSTPRVAPAVALASAYLLVKAARERRWGNAGLLLTFWALFLAWNLAVWGYPWPPNQNPASTLSVGLIPAGLARFFLGNDIGLFLLAPIAFAGVAAGAAILLERRAQPCDLTWALLFLGAASTVAAFPDQRAGTCPSGRYQVVAAYLCLFPLLRGGQLLGSRWRRRIACACLPLGIVSLSVGWAVGGQPRIWFERFHPLFAFERIGSLYWLLPAPGTAPAPLLYLAWAGLFAGLLLLPDAWERILKTPLAPGAPRFWRR